MHRRDAELLRAAQSGDRRARDRVVADHLGLVRSLASYYCGIGLPYDDLVQEGSLGLLDAVKRFDPAQGMEFETYARFRVRRAIRNALTEKSRLIRLPKRVVERRRAIERADALLTSASGHVPTPSELAAATGIPPEAIVEARSAATVSQDATMFEVLVPDEAALDPEREAVRHEQTEQLDAALAELPPRQQEIVRRHFGLGHEPEETAALAADLHLSQQRVRTIEREALYRLRDRLG